eukprot:12301012-Prorocentrum_lima.AAC.1
MTSSLVGSEMCIRDSDNMDARIDTHMNTCMLVLSTSLPICSAPELRPVSYTHLTLPTICSV